MENNDKILELLQKKNLTGEERKLLNSLLQNNDADKLISVYNSVEKAIQFCSHLSFEELGNYILIKNNLEPENKNIYKLIPKIEAHLRKCKKCSEEFKMLNNEHTEIDNFLLKQQKAAREEKLEQVRRLQTLKKFDAVRYAFTSIIVIAAVYFSLLLFSDISTPDYYKYAAIGDESEFYITRGRMTNDFQLSIKALEEKNYDNAIHHLNKDIEQNHNDQTIFYSYYIIGLSYLETAENNFLGLFPSYDKERASFGLKYLKESIAKNNSGKFINITLDAYFYLAKANLMLGNKTAAKEYLTKAINGKGSKMEEAKKILNELE